jgi:hypothetical protein
MTAALLKVSVDTIYDLFTSGELPGRKVGLKNGSPPRPPFFGERERAQRRAEHGRGASQAEGMIWGLLNNARKGIERERLVSDWRVGGDDIWLQDVSLKAQADG